MADTKVDLVLNDLTEAKLQELQNNNQLKPNELYLTPDVEEDTSSIKQIIYEAIYPVNSTKIFMDDIDHSNYLGFTWVKKSSGYALWTSSSGAGQTIAAGLPNITGSADCHGDGYWAEVHNNGALAYERSGQRNSSTGNESKGVRITIDASRINSIYGNSTTVQPPAIKIALWVRTA